MGFFFRLILLLWIGSATLASAKDLPTPLDACGLQITMLTQFWTRFLESPLSFITPLEKRMLERRVGEVDRSFDAFVNQFGGNPWERKIGPLTPESFPNVPYEKVSALSQALTAAGGDLVYSSDVNPLRQYFQVRHGGPVVAARPTISEISFDHEASHFARWQTRRATLIAQGETPPAAAQLATVESLSVEGVYHNESFAMLTELGTQIDLVQRAVDAGGTLSWQGEISIIPVEASVILIPSDLIQKISYPFLAQLKAIYQLERQSRELRYALARPFATQSLRSQLRGRAERLSEDLILLASATKTNLYWDLRKWGTRYPAMATGYDEAAERLAARTLKEQIFLAESWADEGERKFVHDLFDATYEKLNRPDIARIEQVNGG